VTGQWFSGGTTVSSTNKTDHHDITEILLSGVKHHKSNLGVKTPREQYFCYIMARTSFISMR
jgi:hypothetical protein